MKKNGDLTEDDQKQGDKKVQDLTDRYVKMIDSINEKKEQELMSL